MKHVSNRESHREKLHKQITEFLFLDASLNIKRNLLSVLSGIMLTLQKNIICKSETQVFTFFKYARYIGPADDVPLFFLKVEKTGIQF